jgi:gluconokinase
MSSPAPLPKTPRVIILMGVAGSGKTTIGENLAAALGWEFRDADAFHPPENVAKMSRGAPLNDEDRAPWLAAIRAYIERSLAEKRGAIVTCSALRARYRDVILVDAARVALVHLTGSPELLMERISGRKGHFMKPAMLQSQLDALEPPRDALTVDIDATPEEIVTKIRRALAL